MTRLAGWMRRRWVAAVVAAALAGGPALACGPFFPQAIYIQTRHPDLPLAAYAKGALGIVQPTYRLGYLYVAYRVLTGMGFTPAEQAELRTGQLDLVARTFRRPRPGPWLRRWNAAVARQTGASPQPPFYAPNGLYRTLDRSHGVSSFFFGQFLNCPASAFRTALQTWARVRRHFGARSVAADRWFAAQQQVFANCTGGPPVIPAPLPASAPELAQAERNYQIAAANFYAERFSVALSGFRAIAARPGSPWHGIAPYLATRALVREATLNYPQAQFVQAAWTGRGTANAGYQRERSALLAAIRQATATMRNPASTAWRVDARGLRQLAEARLHPRRRLAAIARQLMRHGTADLGQHVRDFNLLYWQAANYEQLRQPPLAANDLLRWITDMRLSPSAVDYNDALRQWRLTPTLPWLVAALTASQPGDAGLPALLRAAAAVPADSPGRDSVQFQALRLELAAHLWQTVYAGASAAASRPAPVSAHNAFLSLAFATAPTLAARWRAAAATRTSEFTLNTEGHDSAIPGLGPAAGVFPVGVRFFFNHMAPLSVWLKAARWPGWRPWQGRPILLAAWTRAVVLDKTAIARSLTGAAGRAAPELAPYLAQYLAADNAPARHFAAARLLLCFPGLHPYLSAPRWDGNLRDGFRHETLSQRDVYRNNWWSPGGLAGFRWPVTSQIPDFVHPAYVGPAPSAPRPGIAFTAAAEGLRRPRALTSAQFAVGQAQQRQLDSQGVAADLLCGWVLVWARQHPRDPRVPPALARAVWATHYGPRDAATGAFSRACFQWLHQRYADSVWARRTPHWYAANSF